MNIDELEGVTEFDWDEANTEKNWIKHKVKKSECEQIFFDPKNIGLSDPKHSQIEKRFLMLGSTKVGRKLIISFTFRGDKVRVISARDQNKKEKSIYENKKTK